MAITYDYRYGQVGQALGSIINTAGTSASLTGLTEGLDYQVIVRENQTSGTTVYYSTWSTPATFTAASTPAVVINLSAIAHSVTLGGISSISVVFGNLATISHSASLNVITPYIVPVADSYDIRINHIQGSVSVISGVLSTTYELTGLIDGDDYEVSIRQVKPVSGASYYSVWSNAVSFAAGGVAPSVVNLGLLNHNVTLGNITPGVFLGVTLGLINHYVSLANVTDGTVTDSSTYSLRVEEVGGSTSYITGLSGNSHGLTGLTEGVEHLVAVKKHLITSGVRYDTTWSANASFVPGTLTAIVVNLTPVTHGITVNPIIAVDDPFYITSTSHINIFSQKFRISGTTNKAIESMTVTIDGAPMGVSFDGSTWNAILGQDTVQISTMEELDGFQPLMVGNQVLEFN